MVERLNGFIFKDDKGYYLKDMNDHKVYLNDRLKGLDGEYVIITIDS